MKNVRKDNKGFSLVELIVVVLIMAIIAVALAPQVLRWVNNSRIANDITALGTMMTAAEVALTNENAYNELKAKDDFTVTLQGSTITTSDSGATNFDRIFRKSIPESFALKAGSDAVAVVRIKNGKLQARTTSESGSYYKVGGTVYTDANLE